MIGRCFAYLSACLLLAVSCAAAAEKPGLQDIVSTLARGYASFEDLQADFTQKSYIAALKREEKGAGELLLRKKGGLSQFRFNYTRPKQQIISNGSSVWYYLPDNGQVILTDTAKLFSGGNAIALSYLTGLGNLTGDFDIRLLADQPDKNGNYLLELVPRKHNPAMARLQLAVPAEMAGNPGAPGTTEPFFPIASSVLFDHMGNRTAIEYRKVRLNRGLPAGRFSFTPPAGVEIIKQ